LADVAAGSTSQPESDVSLREKKLGKFWSQLSQALYLTFDNALSSRTQYDTDLRIYNAFYEMALGVRNWPWKNASNVSTTIIPTQLDTTLANVVLAVYAIQRFYVINGNTPEAANNQHDVEQFLNSELFRPRPGKSWISQHVESLFAALRDGNGVTEILYRKEFANQKVAIVERLQDDSGLPLIDPLSGDPITRTTVEEMNVPIYDDVDLQTVEMRDFGVIPSWQTDIDKAAAVWRRCYLDSNELYSMCKSADNPDGPLKKEAVDFAVSMTPRGNSELWYSRQGYSTYTINGKLDPLLEEGFSDIELQQHVGPLDIIRFHSNQFFDGKEYVFWLHPLSQTMLGYQRYQYWHGQRPFSIKTPFPRVKRFYGFGIPERLIPTVVEIQGNRNRRNDFLDQRTLPPMFKQRGVKLLTKNQSLGPDTIWEVPEGVDGRNAIGILNLPQDVGVMMAGKAEEEVMRNDIEEFTGNSSPMLGQPTSGRPTAKGIQAAVARASVRHNFIAMNTREADARTLYQIVQLKIQYGKDVQESNTSISGVPKKLIIPKWMLAQDFTMTIAGAGGPLDKQMRAQEMQSLYDLLMKNPIVGNDPVKIWGVTRMLLEEYNRADILALIGTRDEAEQQKKAMQMAQAAQQNPLAAAMGGGGQPGGGQPQGGQPGPQVSGSPGA
jgi:hypothetical protein